jgi:FAD/FMN-containing dehydrogenase
MMKYFKSLDDLSNFIKKHQPALYCASQTSTVINFNEILSEKFNFKSEVVNLSSLPKNISFTPPSSTEGPTVEVTGALTWEEGQNFLNDVSGGPFEFLTTPTEKSASILAGIATSCSGERNFGLGSMRDQLISLSYLDFQGELQTLHSSISLINDHPLFKGPGQELLKKYQVEYLPYFNFKNGPVPRLMKETDLMVGTEGQLGVITSACFKIRKKTEKIFLNMPILSHQSHQRKIPFNWRNDVEPLVEFFLKIKKLKKKWEQEKRVLIESCEFLDHESLNMLGLKLYQFDQVYLEIDENNLEETIDILKVTFNFYEEEDFQILTPKQYLQIRHDIPTKINEFNLKHKVSKRGTDIQVEEESFSDLLKFYQEGEKLAQKHKIRSFLFGHLGNAHLHFNFNPQQEFLGNIDDYLEKLYRLTKFKRGSPFAEHGVGLIKQKYLEQFLTETQKEMFRYLKEKMDPHQQFFPEGHFLKYIHYGEESMNE